LPANSSTPTISSSLRRFTIVRAFLQFLGSAAPASTGHSQTRVPPRRFARQSRCDWMSASCALRPKAASPLLARTGH
jgi:hypothetical protein